MNPINRLIVATAISAAAASAAVLPTVAFTLDPLNGYLSGSAGTFVGWGYTITSTSNGDPAFVFIEGFSFGDATPIGDFSQPGVESTGWATDGSPIQESWLLDVSGLQYHIADGALLGSSTQGVMTLIYDVYSDAGQDDPNPTYGLTVNAQMSGQDVNAEVDITAPEPGALTLFVLGAAGLLFRRRSLTRPVQYRRTGR
jgi:hypothetical protein